MTANDDACAAPGRTARPAAGDVVRAVLAANGVFLAFAAAYIAAGGLLLWALGRPWPVWRTTPAFLGVWVVASAAWLAWAFLRRPAWFRQVWRARRVASAVIVAVVVGPFQATFQSVKQSIGPIAGFTWDPALSAADIGLHGRPAWEWLRPLLEAPALVRVFDSVYASWFVAVFVMVMWLSWARDDRVRARALVAVVLLWAIGGTVVAWLVASAGPCYWPAVGTRAADPYGALVRVLDGMASPAAGPLVARANQAGIWELQRAGRWGALAGVSAFPSIHVAMAVLIALVAWARSRPLGVSMAIYATLIAVGSVLLAWHYAVDAYAGAAIAWLCWWGAGRLVRPRPQPSGAVPAPGTSP